MRLRAFAAVVSALALALFAHRGLGGSPHAPFSGVVDLTHSVSEKDPNWDGSEKSPFEARQLSDIDKDGHFARHISLPEHFGTHVDAPAHFARGAPTVDQIPAASLVRPLAVIDITHKVGSNPDYQVSVNDIADWEQANGQIHPGTIVMAHTGWASRWYSMKDYRNADAHGSMHFPGFSLEAVKFLVDVRQIVGLGIDTLSVDYGPSKDFPVHHFTASRRIYQVENLANLERVPESGAMAVIAPMKLEDGSGGPVRALALLE